MLEGLVEIREVVGVLLGFDGLRHDLRDLLDLLDFDRVHFQVKRPGAVGRLDIVRRHLCFTDQLVTLEDLDGSVGLGPELQALRLEDALRPAALHAPLVDRDPSADPGVLVDLDRHAMKGMGRGHHDD